MYAPAQAPCERRFDFSAQGTLPFTVAFLGAEADLRGNRIWRYRIEGVGSQGTGICSLTLGLNRALLERSIENVSAVLNDLPRMVLFGRGGNVEWNDGLQFRFPLRDRDTLELAFRLPPRFAEGAMPVTLVGDRLGNGVLPGPMIETDASSAQSFSDARCLPREYAAEDAAVRARVRLPVQLRVEAVAETPTLHCLGEPTVVSRAERTGCEMLIQQNVCVRLPLRYCVESEAGNATISMEPQG